VRLSTDELEEDDGLDDLVGALSRERAKKSVRDGTKDRASSVIEMGRLQNLELTSMISLAALEQEGQRPIDQWDDSDHGDDDRVPGEPSVELSGPVMAPAAPARPNETGVPARPSARPARPARPPGGTQGDVQTEHVPPIPPRRSWLIPALVAVLVIIAALVAAWVIGTSGPDVN